MFNNVGFFTRRRGLGAAGGIAPSPGREITITPTLIDNGNGVIWGINTNMEPNVVLNYQLLATNVISSDQSNATGNITLNSTGDATLNVALQPLFVVPGNLSLQLKLTSPSNTLLSTSSNVVARGLEITVIPTISNNSERVVWTINSNYAANTVVNYQIVGANVQTFHEGVLTDSITLNATGDGTLTRNLDRFYEYASNVTKPISLAISSTSNVVIATSSNVIVKAANTFAATGGNVITFTGGVDNLPGEYTVHAFNSNANISISTLGENPSNANVELLVVAGGGAGAAGSTFNQILFGSYNAWNREPGGGGGGGGVINTAIKANTLIAQSYGVTVGSGGISVGSGDLSPVKGANSSVFNFIAIGGGGGVPGAGINALRNGGSGAGGSIFTGGQGTTGQGKAGGNAAVYSTPGTRISYGSGGGGGNAQVGANGIASSHNTVGGNGGQGFTSTITGNTIIFGSGGGGGGFTGGTGGTNAGAGAGFTSVPVGGTAPAGFGGGGGGAGMDTENGTTTNLGGNGGSGAVYVRYLSKYRNLGTE